MTDHADRSVVQILQYLEERELLKKTMMEGLSEHIPFLSRIVDWEFIHEKSSYLEKARLWILTWTEKTHQTHTGEVRDCKKPLCRSAKKTIEQM